MAGLAPKECENNSQTLRIHNIYNTYNSRCVPFIPYTLCLVPASPHDATRSHRRRACAGLGT